MPSLRGTLIGYVLFGMFRAAPHGLYTGAEDQAATLSAGDMDVLGSPRRLLSGSGKATTLGPIPVDCMHV